MRFWDTSALVPLFAYEAATATAQRLYGEQPAIVWWGTVVECASAIARLERDGALTAAQAIDAFGRLDALAASWIEIEAGDEVRDVARRMLRVHSLRAASHAALPLVTLDDRLRAAAAREGFPLVDL